MIYLPMPLLDRGACPSLAFCGGEGPVEEILQSFARTPWKARSNETLL
jgi:hypothetical protein